jgi:hypothetical protein
MLMKGLQGERMRQAFRYFDKKQTGYIEPADFARIIRELARHKLSDSVLERLPTLCTITAGQKISYPEVRAFQNVRPDSLRLRSAVLRTGAQVLKEMEGVENIIRTACAKSKDGRINRADFLNTAAQSSRYNGFSPMEVSIIFHFAGATGGDGEKRLALRDFGQVRTRARVYASNAGSLMHDRTALGPEVGGAPQPRLRRPLDDDHARPRKGSLQLRPRWHRRRRWRDGGLPDRLGA